MELPVEELTMFMDAPLDQAGSPTIYVVAKDQNSQATKNNFLNKLGVCSEYRANDLHPVSPIFDAKDYFLKYKKGPIVVAKENNNLQIRTETQIEVAKQPRHGRLSLFRPDAADSDIGKYDYHYTPDKDYVGLDNFEFLVSVDGKSLKVYYQVKVFPEDENPNYVGYCNWEKPTWKISQSDFNPGTQDYAAWLRSSELSTLLADASQSVAGFQDLAGSAVGNTAGEGSNAAITLASTAAGHGWYIDPTPLDNTDDYLPTSNPNIWQAKAGTDAAGKMDMLSVLLHEYGHALGLDHSADSGDFMAATLQVGNLSAPEPGAVSGN